MPSTRLDRMVGLAKYLIAGLADYHTRIAWTKVAIKTEGVPDSYKRNIVKVLTVQIGKLQEVVQELAKHLDEEFDAIDEIAGLK